MSDDAKIERVWAPIEILRLIADPEDCMTEDVALAAYLAKGTRLMGALMDGSLVPSVGTERVSSETCYYAANKLVAYRTALLEVMRVEGDTL